MALFLITGASGVGKTSIMQGVSNDSYGSVQEVVSHTTRDMREGEVKDKSYYFVSRDEFKNMREQGKFLENIEYKGNFYGISKDEVERKLKLCRNTYIIATYDGYKQVKKEYPDAVGIFLHMSKEDCLANMLLRGDSYEQALERVKLYDEEMKNKIHFDYVIKNVRNKKILTETIIKSIIMQY